MHLPGLYKTETHLFPQARNLLTEKLKLKLAKPSRKNAQKAGLIYFNGFLYESGFSISKNNTYPQYFLPIIKGEFIEGEKETLLHLVYELYRGAKVFLVLWSGICLLAFLFCVLVMKIPFYGLIALVVLLLNYMIVLANFNLHCKQSKTLLLFILN